jgi:hypothetical protein
MKLAGIGVGVAALVGTAVVAGIPAASQASNASAGVPRYDHIIEIMMENQSYSTIIGNTDAPRLNALANQYGLATNYWGVTHPSEPNYVASVGGDFFGIQDDDQFYCNNMLHMTEPASWNCGTSYPTGVEQTYPDHTISDPNIASQLTAAHMTWKGYFQSLPAVPASGPIMIGPNANGPYTFKSPTNAHALYASKHNPFVNFTDTQGALDNMVPDTQLATDLANDTLPNFGLVVPDQCNDMHGTGGCANPDLIAAGDQYVGNLVNTIMSSSSWQNGKDAIVITWDEDDFSDSGQPGTGCCGSPTNAQGQYIGGGHVATIVITNQDETHKVDNTAYNHYSLLRTEEAAFGLPPIANAGNTAAGVVPMAKLFGEQ